MLLDPPRSPPAQESKGGTARNGHLSDGMPSREGQQARAGKTPHTEQQDSPPTTIAAARSVPHNAAERLHNTVN